MEAARAHFKVGSKNLVPSQKNTVETKQRVVMICDDDEDVLKLFGQALKSKYNVILVSSGKDCIEKLIELQNLGQKIHPLLLDYRLNGMFGDSVVRKIKEYSETKIILISAYNVDDELL
jgi:CheY-like chemotaxis protein